MVPKFKEVISDHGQYMNEWKARTNRKVIGYLCTYLAEEIVYAGGLLPIRIIASEEPPVNAERYMAQWTCPFSRGCLEQGLTGQYDYVDALVYPWTCSHTSATSFYWKEYVPNAETYLISMPKALARKGARSFLVAELLKFKNWLEQFGDVKIEDKDLERGIEICNTSRRLMRQVYELRRQDPPVITGVEAVEMVMSSQMMDKEEHSRLLAQWLENHGERPRIAKTEVRLMAVGSCVDKPQVLQMIEDMGANVVVDDLCTGSRYFWDDVQVEPDLLGAIGQRLIDRVNCPAKIAGDRRYQHILKLAREYNVHGVIVLHQKFCNPHGNDYPNLRNTLVENDFPVLQLELDIPVPSGQIKTRVQTFVEMLEVEKV
ncbi:MAG: 2-hydroxyacyl-CoA dehydratase [Desulfobacterales bacterium]|nr:2-hydroxyacyl-CoA dehydratase [Desulfobacterales bacterium]